MTPDVAIPLSRRRGTRRLALQATYGHWRFVREVQGLDTHRLAEVACGRCERTRTIRLSSLVRGTPRCLCGAKPAHETRARENSVGPSQPLKVEPYSDAGLAVERELAAVERRLASVFARLDGAIPISGRGAPRQPPRRAASRPEAV